MQPSPNAVKARVPALKARVPVPRNRKQIQYTERDVRLELEVMIRKLANMKLHSEGRVLTSDIMPIIDNCVRIMYVLYHEEDSVIHAVRAVALTAVTDLLHHTDNLTYNSEDCELPPEIALYLCKCLVQNQDEVTSISMMKQAYTENMDQAACNLVLANRLFDHIRKYGTSEQVAADERWTED